MNNWIAGFAVGVAVGVGLGVAMPIQQKILTKTTNKKRRKLLLTFAVIGFIILAILTLVMLFIR
jgi:hypothetical protein